MKNRMVLGMLALGCMLSLNQAAVANHVVVTNAALVWPDAGEKYVYVKFDIAWSNSWRTAMNWDAAWVFVKFQAPGSDTWQHATLSATNGDHVAAPGSEVHASSDGKGAFIYRTGTAAGNVSFAELRLRWAYGADGQNFAQGAQIPISVHAIEMVYVPKGDFYLGSTGAEYGHFYKYTDGSQDTEAYLVSSEAAIPVGKENGNLCYEIRVNQVAYNYGDGLGPIPEAFPKGYNAFYCMKYELTQGQYADFLNKLTAEQCKNRYPNANGRDRHTISGSYGKFAAEAPQRACNYISWADACAYAAWAALRPMTELEFEKACRGPAAPVPYEYAWGSTVIQGMRAEQGTPGMETSATPGANCVCGHPGPARVGIFEVPGASREATGAGYYGVMELSANLNERAVTVGMPQGRSFTNACGSGVLSPAGDAPIAEWHVADAKPCGQRGGYWRHGAISLPPPPRHELDWGITTVSSRNFAANVHPVRNEKYGWRGVRAAP